MPTFKCDAIEFFDLETEDAVLHTLSFLLAADSQHFPQEGVLAMKILIHVIKIATKSIHTPSHKTHQSSFSLMPNELRLFLLSMMPSEQHASPTAKLICRKIYEVTLTGNPTSCFRQNAVYTCRNRMDITGLENRGGYGARIIMLMTVIIPTMYVATDVGLFVGSAGYAMFLLQQTEMSIAVGMSVKEKTNRGKYPNLAGG